MVSAHMSFKQQPSRQMMSMNAIRPQGTLHLSDLGLPDQPFQEYIRYASP